MLSTVLVGSIFAVLLTGLIGGALLIHRRQRAQNAKREAAQLQRRADHLLLIAVAAQVHTRSDTIARVLLEEAVAVLEHSSRLDSRAEQTANTLHECRELIENLDTAAQATTDEGHDAILEFPETELIEAQLHLTEAVRLLSGLEKRGKISYDGLVEMTAELKQAQRALDLRLQLRQATHTLDKDRSVPKPDEARAGEYLAALERNRAQSSH